MATATKAPEQVVEAYANLWNQQEYEKIPDVVSDEYVLYDPIVPGDTFPGPAGEVHGPDGLEQYIRASVKAFPDLHMANNTMVASDDIVMTEETVTATHEGELFGLPPTGRKVMMNEMQKYHVEDGKVAMNAVYYNVEEVKEQLGLTFPAIVWQLPKLAWRKVRSPR